MNHPPHGPADPSGRPWARPWPLPTTAERPTRCAPSSPDPSAARRGGAGTGLLAGVLVAGAVGLLVWKLNSGGEVVQEASDEDVAALVGQDAAPMGPAAPVDGQAADDLLQALLGADAQDGAPAAEAGEAIADLLASQGTEQLDHLVASGKFEISAQARELLASGQLLPADWVRVDAMGVVRVGAPRPVAPPYKAISAPYVEARTLPFSGAPVPADAESAIATEGGLPGRGIWRGKPALADLDGDGDQDLIASLRMWSGGDKGEGLHVWLDDGGTGGPWRASVAGLRRDLGYGGVDVADLDGDGALDLAFACHNGHPRAYLARREGGEVRWVESSRGLEAMGVSADVALGDWTGDGVPELAAVGIFSGTGGLYAFSYDRERDTWFLLAELLPQVDFGYQVRSADLDGDGREELIATTNRGVKVFGYEEGAFVDRSAGLAAPMVGGTLLQALPLDLDGDGSSELLVAGLHTPQGLPLTLHRRDAEGVWRQVDADLPATESIRDAEFVELDGDALPELLLLGLEGLMLADVSPAGDVKVVARIGPPEALYHCTVGDLDGDGRDEAVVVKTGGVVLLDLLATWEAALAEGAEVVR